MPPRKAAPPPFSLAIDLGFRTTEVAVLDGDRPAAVPLRGSVILRALAAGGAGLPTVVHGTPGGDLVAGEEAEAQLINKPRSTVAGVSRLLGLDHERLAAHRPALWSGLAFRRANDGSVEVEIDGKAHGAEALCAAVLRRVKQGAEASLGVPVDAATIAVSAGTSEKGRAALAAAAGAAGLELRGLVEAPAAIARAWWASRPAGSARERVAVVRMGGGSTDLALASVGAEGVDLLARRSEPELGGTDLDSRVAEWVADRVHAGSGVDLRKEPASMRRLARVGEEVRITLSSRESEEMSLPFLSMGPKGPVNVAELLTQSTLEGLVRDLVERVLAHARALAGDVALGGRPVDQLILVGGTTRMPLLRRELEAVFGGPAAEDFDDLGAIARGAALLGGDPSPNAQRPRKPKT
jgi:molecular chaperone DnaK